MIGVDKALGIVRWVAKLPEMHLGSKIEISEYKNDSVLYLQVGNEGSFFVPLRSYCATEVIRIILPSWEYKYQIRYNLCSRLSKDGVDICLDYYKIDALPQAQWPLWAVKVLSAVLKTGLSDLMVCGDDRSPALADALGIIAHCGGEKPGETVKAINAAYYVLFANGE